MEIDLDDSPDHLTLGDLLDVEKAIDAYCFFPIRQCGGCRQLYDPELCPIVEDDGHVAACPHCGWYDDDDQMRLEDVDEEFFTTDPPWK